MQLPDHWLVIVPMGVNGVILWWFCVRTQWRGWLKALFETEASKALCLFCKSKDWLDLDLSAFCIKFLPSPFPLWQCVYLGRPSMTCHLPIPWHFKGSLMHVSCQLRHFGNVGVVAGPEGMEIRTKKWVARQSSICSCNAVVHILIVFRDALLCQALAGVKPHPSIPVVYLPPTCS